MLEHLPAGEKRGCLISMATIATANQFTQYEDENLPGKLDGLIWEDDGEDAPDLDDLMAKWFPRDEEASGER